MYQSLLQAEQREKQLLVSQKDAEYQVLRAQINPHYLFNTLEVIRMKLLLEGGARSGAGLCGCLRRQSGNTWMCSAWKHRWAKSYAL